MKTFTEEEVIDLLVHLQVANKMADEKLFKNINKKETFGEFAKKIVKTYIDIKNSNKSAISFLSMLQS